MLINPSYLPEQKIDEVIKLFSDPLELDSSVFTAKVALICDIVWPRIGFSPEIRTYALKKWFERREEKKCNSAQNMNIT